LCCDIPKKMACLFDVYRLSPKEGHPTTPPLRGTFARSGAEGDFKERGVTRVRVVFILSRAVPDGGPF